jgi:hypothetical protein
MPAKKKTAARPRSGSAKPKKAKATKRSPSIAEAAPAGKRPATVMAARSAPLLQSPSASQAGTPGQVDNLFVTTDNTAGDLIGLDPVQHNVDSDHTSALTSITMPLGGHVSMSLKQKIWDGEFVEMAAMLVDNGNDRNYSAPSFTISSNGSLSVAAPKHRPITSIEVWTDAFLTFASIFGARHHERLQELLKYASVIRDAARKFPGRGWLEYDSQFRRRQAINPGANWARIDGELWLTVMIPSSINYGQSAGNTAAEQGEIRTPFPLYSRKGYNGKALAGAANGGHTNSPFVKLAEGVCYKFNRPSGCSAKACRWPHVCATCKSSKHSIMGHAGGYGQPR